MKHLRSNLYRDICSILCNNDKTYKTNQNIVLFSRILSAYPSKNIYCLTAHRVITFLERNINSMSLMIEIMMDEGEEEEIVSTVKLLNAQPTITTQSEITRLCTLLTDYLKWSNVLKKKDSLIRTLDIINSDDDPVDLKEHVELVYNIASEIVSAYNVANVTAVQHTFDTSDVDAGKTVIASAKDVKNPNKVIITGLRGLNQLLSPGYLPGYLYVYAALPGNYKSGVLLESHIDTCRFNAHIKETTNGKTPISMYISMENTMDQTIRRIWSILYPNSDMDMFTVDEISEMINNALTVNGFRSVILYYGYREKSTYDIANIIRSYNDDKNEVVALFFDYIKRVRPGRTDAAATANEKAELNAIMNEFKLMASQFNIPIITAHQLNRMAQTAIDTAAQNGGWNKSSELLGRSQIGSAFEVVEVADWLGIINVETSQDTKYLMIKAAKQRDKESNQDANIIAIRHPFISTESFALKIDINENVMISIPLYNGIQHTNYVAAGI